MPRLRLVLAVLLAVGARGTGLAAAETLPPWAAEAAAFAAPPDLGDAKALILLNETLVEFAPDGRRTTRTRVALRILTREGRAEARAAAAYLHPADKLRQLSAWLRAPDGTVRHFGRKDIVDVALDPEMLYSEARTAVIDASAEAAEGALFAWEAITEEPPAHAQGVCVLQHRLPVTVARCQLRLPQGWHATGDMLDHAPLAPVATADGLRWEVHNLPALKVEPLAPPPDQQAARVHFDLQPPPPARGRPPLLRSFASWADLTQFARARFAPASNTAPALHAKVQSLCAGKTTTWEKTCAIAEFVQSLRYVAIAANLRRDGGFTPRPAPTVLATGYGDCKDKTSLLCALLADAGITAYPVLCFSGDRDAVHPEWPSPSQFNHMVAAIRVEEAPDSPHCVDDPQAGRLLLFDPTDQFTRIGEFPLSNQGSLALICTPTAERLTRVPFAPPAKNHTTSSLKASLAPDGTLAIDLVETDRGAAAAAERHQRNERAKKRQAIADSLKQSIPGAIHLQAETRDLPGTDACELTARFSIAKYAQPVGKDLFALRPVLVGALPFPALNEKERTRPLRLHAMEREYVAIFTLPEGYQAVETGPDLRLDRSFGTYEASTAVEGSTIVFRQTLVLQPTDIPPSSYEELRTFLDAAHKRERTPILLERR